MVITHLLVIKKSHYPLFLEHHILYFIEIQGI